MDGIQPILVVISIHSPLAGRDPHQSAQCVYQRFQSTRPSRGETAGTVWKRVKSIFQSTRPSRGETRRCDLLGGHAAISIHSPLAGRDDEVPRSPGLPSISIHSPLAGRDSAPWCRCSGTGYFNPLAPRGARRRPGRGPPPRRDFNPLAPRGARRADQPQRPGLHENFNPLAPRGARRRFSPICKHRNRFQSTRPSRGETC